MGKGYSQEEGLDFTDTFAPVTKLTIVRTIISIAMAKGWNIYQLDMQNAFLHEDLHEVTTRVYIHLMPK